LNKFIKYSLLSLVLASIISFFVIRIHRTNNKHKNEITNFLRFSQKQGFYTEPFELKIKNTNPEDTIYYTLDGSIPTKKSFVYKSPVKIDYKYNSPNIISKIQTVSDAVLKKNFFLKPFADSIVFKATVIRVVTYRDNIPRSKVYTYTFFVDSVIYSRYSMPIISLVTDANNFFSYDKGIYVPGKYYDKTNPVWSGNHYQKGKEWERPVNITFFEKNGDIAFSQDAGIRINGLGTRRYPFKPFRLYARNKYGNKYFNYRLFPEKEQNIFKRFVLRTAMGSEKNGFKDALIHNIAKNLNLDIQDSRPVIVFLNGEYWGLYKVRDYFDEYYLSLKYGFDKDKFDILTGINTVIVKQGSKEHYDNLINFIKENDLSYSGGQKNYEYIKTQMDIENFIDYQITNIYFNNMDWLGQENNTKFWRPQINGGKWRWFLCDFDDACMLEYNYDFNLLKHIVDTDKQHTDMSTFFIKNLLKNDEFKNQFINRFIFLMNTTFCPDTVLSKIDKFKKNYQREVEKNFNRWFKTDYKTISMFSGQYLDTNYVSFTVFWHDIINKSLKDFVVKRPYYMKKFLIKEFGLEQDSLYNFEELYKKKIKKY